MMEFFSFSFSPRHIFCYLKNHFPSMGAENSLNRAGVKKYHFKRAWKKSGKM